MFTLNLPFALGLFAGIAELQLVGQPIQQPSLNQRHSSPVQKAPLLCQLADSLRTVGSLSREFNRQIAD